MEASILTNGLYSVHLQNWLDAGFKREQMLILNGEELISNPAKVSISDKPIATLTLSSDHTPSSRVYGTRTDHQGKSFCF